MKKSFDYDLFLIVFFSFAEPSTPYPNDPTVITTSKSASKAPKPYILLVAGLIGAGCILLLTSVFLCFFMKRRKKSGLHGIYEQILCKLCDIFFHTYNNFLCSI